MGKEIEESFPRGSKLAIRSRERLRLFSAMTSLKDAMNEESPRKAAAQLSRASDIIQLVIKLQFLNTLPLTDRAEKRAKLRDS